MSKILEFYKAAQKSLGLDKISKEAGIKKQTPYTTDDLKKVDEQVVTAAKFKTGRTGELKSGKYSDTVKGK
jgi:hypothetical protein